MPIDFDPVFHTETMVKILREQGSTQYAMELAELILQKNPQHEGVRRILEELREEARRAFERFKSGGRPADAAVAVEVEAAEEISNPEIEVVGEGETAIAEIPDEEPALASQVEIDAAPPEPIRLTLVPPPPPPSGRETKILRLQALLRRVQSLRKAVHASQA